MTYQDDDGNEGKVGEEVSRLREARGLRFQLASIRVQEVRVKDQAELRCGEDQRGDEPPHFRYGSQGENLVFQEDDGRRADDAHPCRNG